MSLINVKNFVAPFHSKPHLAGILLAVCLFAAFRISGGSIEIQSPFSARGVNLHSTINNDADEVGTFRGRQLKQAGSNERTKLEDFPAPPGTDRNMRRPAPAAINDNGNLLDDLVRERSLGESQKLREEPTAANNQPKAKESLDDIERRLGLR